MPRGTAFADTGEQQRIEEWKVIYEERDDVALVVRTVGGRSSRDHGAVVEGSNGGCGSAAGAEPPAIIHCKEVRHVQLFQNR